MCQMVWTPATQWAPQASNETWEPPADLSREVCMGPRPRPLTGMLKLDGHWPREQASESDSSGSQPQPHNSLAP